MTASSSAPAARPKHVPADLVWDHNYTAFLQELDDPFLAGGRLHEGPGIIWATNANYGNPAWILTQQELIKEAFADYEHFSSQRSKVNAAIMDSDWLLLPVEADPPDHHFYREILLPFFTPKAINSMKTSVEELCENLITGFVQKGSCEFIGEFASILPNSIVISLLGMPMEMLEQFLDWEEKAVRGKDNTERAAAARAIIDYLKAFIAEQQAAPGSDIMRAILNARVGDRSFSDAEILGTVYLLFVAGLDTVYNTIGWVMRHLAMDQQLQGRLRSNPADIPAAVEEFTRAYGVSAPKRTVARDFDFHGVSLRAGDDVILPTYLAGRDPRAYANPHQVDIDRKPRHVTFGNGPHFCVGIHLAKREIAIVIEAMLRRLKSFRIQEGAVIRYNTSSTIGLDSLPLVWDQ